MAGLPGVLRIVEDRIAVADGAGVGADARRIHLLHHRVRRPADEGPNLIGDHSVCPHFVS